MKSARAAAPSLAFIAIIGVLVSAGPLGFKPIKPESYDPITESPLLFQTNQTNNTRSWSGFPQELNISEGISGFPKGVTRVSPENHTPMLVSCFLPTCHLDKLADNLQYGDEKAGAGTLDPFGPGKK